MPTTPLRISRRINAPAAVVWRLLVDTRLWPHWGPSVSAVSASPRLIHPGHRGRVAVLGKVWLPFEICRFVPGHYWSWRVGGIPATGHRVSALGNSRCRLCFEIPIWAAPYALVCWLAMGRIRRMAENRCGLKPDSFRTSAP